jgi:hypothetical protein
VIDVDPSAHGSWQIRIDNLILMPGYLLFMPMYFILGAILDPLGEAVFNTIAYWGFIIVSAISYAGVVLIVLKLVSMWRSRRTRSRGVSPLR